MKLPTTQTYCENTTAKNAQCITTPDGTQYYFSYQTIMAIRTPDGELKIRENDWGPTTGKHLNAIDGGSPEAKRARMNGEAFEEWTRSFSIPC